MSGSRKVGVGEIRQHHDEVRTINRNWLGTLDYTSTTPGAWRPRCRFSTGPIRTSTTTWARGCIESWDFTEVGDMRVLGRRQWRAESAARAAPGFLRPQLRPEAAHRQGRCAQRRRRARRAHAAAGHRHDRPAARRLLQPGARLGSSWFADALVQTPLGEHDNFKPGARASVDLGYRCKPPSSSA